jgi:hypothetical protein
VRNPAGTARSIQPHFAADEIDLAPFERQDLRRDAPARDLRELDHRAKRCRGLGDATPTADLAAEEQRSRNLVKGPAVLK